MKSILFATSLAAIALAGYPAAANTQPPSAVDRATLLRGDLNRSIATVIATTTVKGEPLQKAVEDALEGAITASGVEPAVALNALEGLISPSAEANAAVEAVKERIRKVLGVPLRPLSFGGTFSLPSNDLGATGGGGSDYTAP